MAESARVTPDEIATVARLANLNLPPDRRDQLATTYAAFLDNLERLWELDPGDRDPPAITYESEVQE